MGKRQYPLPKISIDIDEINAKGNTIIEGNFTIKNISQGVLSGKITSDIFDLKFTPDAFNENVCTIKYTYDCSHVNGSITGRAIIETNGGEVVIPITLICEKEVNNLNTFAECASKDFLKAKDIFISENFLELYNIKNSGLRKLYKRLNLDVYKEVALDNFLILTKKKEPTKINITKSKIELKIDYFENRKIKYNLPLEVVGWGTLEATISADKKEEWFELPVTNINNNNVKNGEFLEVPYIIDTKFVKDNCLKSIVEINSNYFNEKLEIIIKREDLLVLELSKDCYNSMDMGLIKIKNNTGGDLKIDLDSAKKWVQFKSKKYFISSYAEIPFEVKFSKVFDLAKTPIYTTTIIVKATIDGKPIRKYIDVKIFNAYNQ